MYRWEFKARHFDSTMLFKMGKFYEMFEMDAHVGVEVLGLIYMKVGMALTCGALNSIPHIMRWAPGHCWHPTFMFASCALTKGPPCHRRCNATLHIKCRSLCTWTCNAVRCIHVQGIIGQSLHADLRGPTSPLWVIMLQGEQPHCGFPEKNYHHNAERLARAGLKVVVVEQTETPDQLRIRNEERKANKQNQVGACPLLQHFPCCKVMNIPWRKLQ